MSLLTSPLTTSNVEVVADWQRVRPTPADEEVPISRDDETAPREHAREEEMTLAEAAAHSGLAQGTLRVLIHRRRMTGRKRGRDWFVTLASIETYLTSRDSRGRRPRNPKAERR